MRCTGIVARTANARAIGAVTDVMLQLPINDSCVGHYNFFFF
jgi:hypothetical protein